MSDTDLLRRAANRARGIAQDAIEKNLGWMVEEKAAPLHSDDDADLYSHDLRWAVVRDLYPHHEVAMDLTKGHAEHVALWHPGIAFAVAEWLDQHAAEHDVYDCERERDACAALKTARALLGEDPR